nr:MAG TPA: hypothetical protein [Caudoviricetes sp.]
MGNFTGNFTGNEQEKDARYVWRPFTLCRFNQYHHRGSAYVLGKHDSFILFRGCKKSRRFIDVIPT